jgi:hypothetical protein
MDQHSSGEPESATALELAYKLTLQAEELLALAEKDESVGGRQGYSVRLAHGLARCLLDQLADLQPRSSCVRCEVAAPVATLEVA